MIEPHELSDAPPSIADALEAPVVSITTADVVAKPKPKKRKKKKAKAVRNLGAELRASVTDAPPSEPSSGPSPQEAPPAESPAGGDFDRGERFRAPFQPAPASPTDVATVAEQVAPPLRSRIARGDFDKYVVIAVMAFAASLGVAAALGLLPV